MSQKNRLICILAILLSTIVVSASAMEVTRTISPKTIAPGESVTVEIKFTADEDLIAPALIEKVPEGWSVPDESINVYPPATGAGFREDKSQVEVLWFPSIPAGVDVSVRYTLIAPSTAEQGVYTLYGNVTYVSATVEISGDRNITVAVPNRSVDLVVVGDSTRYASAGETVTFELKVKNTGNLDDTYELTTDNPDAVLSDSVVSVPAGGEETVYLNYTLKETDDTVLINVTAISQANSVVKDTVQLTVIRAKPDLVLKDISLSPMQPVVDRDVNITVEVKNNGVIDASEFNVSLYIDGTLIGTETVSGLVSGGTKEVSFVWTPTSAGNYTLAVQVDPENKVDELNENNNEMSKNVTVVELLGDVTGDGYVNVLDVIRVGQHFGETGEPGWIPEDLNKDGVINVLDIIIIGQNWTG